MTNDKLDRLKSLVGKCFVYRFNCFGPSSGAEDYWDDFMRVLDFQADGKDLYCFIVEKFSTNSRGHSTLQVMQEYGSLSALRTRGIPFIGYERYREKDYQRMKLRLMKELQTAEICRARADV